MPKTATTFKQGEGKPKGAKNKRTLLREEVGLDTWEAVRNWLVNEGLEKYKEELMKLKGKDYLFGHTTLMEYFKPKLARTTLEGGEKPIEINNITFS